MNKEIYDKIGELAVWVRDHQDAVQADDMNIIISIGNHEKILKPSVCGEPLRIAVMIERILQGTMGSLIRNDDGMMS